MRSSYKMSISDWLILHWLALLIARFLNENEIVLLHRIKYEYLKNG